MKAYLNNKACFSSKHAFPRITVDHCLRVWAEEQLRAGDLSYSPEGLENDHTRAIYDENADLALWVSLCPGFASAEPVLRAIYVEGRTVGTGTKAERCHRRFRVRLGRRLVSRPWRPRETLDAIAAVEVEEVEIKEVLAAVGEIKPRGNRRAYPPLVRDWKWV